MSRGRALDGWITVFRPSWHWSILPILIVGGILRAWPLLDLPPDLPLNGGGLYYQFTTSVLDNGLSYPRTIPFYTDGGIPFAYPPLAFYAAAAISAISGVPVFDLHVLLPVAFSIMAMLAFPFLAREVLVERGQVALATAAYALPLFAFRDLVPGEGMVEALATTMFVIGSILLFRIDGSTRDVAYVGALLGLLALTSLEVALAFLVCATLASLIRLEGSWRWRSPLLICGVAAAVSSPYWVMVLGEHGVDVFLNALGAVGAGGGSSGGGMPLIQVAVAAIGVLGAGHCVHRRRFLLPSVTVAVLLLPKVDYLLPALLALLIPVAVLRLLPRLLSGRRRLREAAVTVVPALLVASLLIASVASIDVPPTDREELAFEAMGWVRENVDEGASFIMVVDHEAEFSKVRDWFPAIAERTTLNVFYGTEWTGEFPGLVRMNDALVAAGTAGELEGVIAENGMGAYTHLLISNDTENADVIDDLSASPGHEMVHMNDGYLIFSREA